MDVFLFSLLSIHHVSSMCVCLHVQLPQAQQGQTGTASSQPNLLHMPHRQSPLHQASSSSSTSSSSSALSVGQLVSSKCSTHITLTQHAFSCIKYRMMFSSTNSIIWAHINYKKLISFHISQGECSYGGGFNLSHRIVHPFWYCGAERNFPLKNEALKHPNRSALYRFNTLGSVFTCGLTYICLYVKKTKNKQLCVSVCVFIIVEEHVSQCNSVVCCVLISCWMTTELCVTIRLCLHKQYFVAGWVQCWFQSFPGDLLTIRKIIITILILENNLVICNENT